MQFLLNQFLSARWDFGLTISLKKTKVLSQGTDIHLLSRSMTNIENVKNYVYLGTSIVSNAPMDIEINCCIGKALSTFSWLLIKFARRPKKRTKKSEWYTFFYYLMYSYFYLAVFTLSCLCFVLLSVHTKSSWHATYNKFRLIAGNYFLYSFELCKNLYDSK